MAAPRLAYIAGIFPKASETFVYREVRALREGGRHVQCVSLRSSTEAPKGADDLLRDLLVLYEGAWWRDSLMELLTRPLTSARTLALSLLDAAQPEEQLALSGRLRLPVQAFSSLALAAKLRKRAVEHVHAHFAHAPSSVAMYAAYQLGGSFSFTGHANDIFERRALLKKKLRRASFVSCISEWHRDFYRKEEPAARSLRLVRCGVDCSDFSMGTTETRLSGEMHELGARALRLCVVARLVPKKGIDILIRALSLSKADLRLKIAGDGPEKEKLQALVKELGLQERVQFLGSVENSEARDLLKESELFVLPCRVDEQGDKDGIPVALMEAMASGLLTISGDLPAIRELISDGETGFLLKTGKAEELAELLDGLSLSQLSQLRAAGRERVVQEFSLQKNVERLTAAFDEISAVAADATSHRGQGFAIGQKA